MEARRLREGEVSPPISATRGRRPNGERPSPDRDAVGLVARPAPRPWPCSRTIPSGNVTDEEDVVHPRPGMSRSLRRAHHPRRWSPLRGPSEGAGSRRIGRTDGDARRGRGSTPMSKNPDGPASTPPSPASSPRRRVDPERPRGGWDLSYRPKLVLGVCGLVLLTGPAVTWLAHRSARASTEALADSLFREVSGHAVTHTRGFVLRAAPLVESLQQPRRQRAGPRRPRPPRPPAARRPQGQPRPELGQLQRRGRHVHRGVPHARRRAARQPEPHRRTARHAWSSTTSLPDGTLEGLPPRRRQRLRPARPAVLHQGEAGGPARLAAALRLLRPGRARHLVRRPVRDDGGRLRGVLSVDFDLNALSDFVAGLSVSEHSRVFLFTADETLLAHPEPARWCRPRGETAPATPHPRRHRRPAGRRLSRRTSGPSTSSPADGEAFHRFEFRHDGTEYLGSATTFRVGDDLVWVVGAVAPKADFLRRRLAEPGARAGRGRAAALLVAVLLAAALARRGLAAGAVAHRVHAPRRRRRPGREGRLRRQPRVPPAVRRAQPHDRRPARPAAAAALARRRDGGAAAAAAAPAAAGPRPRRRRAQHLLRRDRRRLLRLPRPRRGRARQRARRAGRRDGARRRGGAGHGRRPGRPPRPGRRGRQPRGADGPAQPPARRRPRRQPVHDDAPVGHRRPRRDVSAGSAPATTRRSSTTRRRAASTEDWPRATCRWGHGRHASTRSRPTARCSPGR